MFADWIRHVKMLVQFSNSAKLEPVDKKFTGSNFTAWIDVLNSPISTHPAFFQPWWKRR